MPFTPFHMGAALVLKPVARRRLSLFAFGAAQIVMDIEPLLGMQLGWERLHGWTHTLLGALVLAPVAVLLTRWLYPPIARWWNRHMQQHRCLWLAMPLPLAAPAVWVGAVFGTLSHVFLDALMHADLQPFVPLSQANPLLGWVSMERVYQGCTVAAGLGMLAWLWQLWRARVKG